MSAAVQGVCDRGADTWCCAVVGCIEEDGVHAHMLLMLLLLFDLVDRDKIVLIMLLIIVVLPTSTLLCTHCTCRPPCAHPSCPPSPHPPNLLGIPALQGSCQWCRCRIAHCCSTAQQRLGVFDQVCTQHQVAMLDRGAHDWGVGTCAQARPGGMHAWDQQPRLADV